MKKTQYLCILFVILLSGCKADVVPTPYTTHTPYPTLTSDLELTLAPGVAVTLVRIPEGEFLMGTTDGDTQVVCGGHECGASAEITVQNPPGGGQAGRLFPTLYPG